MSKFKKINTSNSKFSPRFYLKTPAKQCANQLSRVLISKADNVRSLSAKESWNFGTFADGWLHWVSCHEQVSGTISKLANSRRETNFFKISWGINVLTGHQQTTTTAHHHQYSIIIGISCPLLLYRFTTTRIKMKKLPSNSFIIVLKNHN